VGHKLHATNFRLWIGSGTLFWYCIFSSSSCNCALVYLFPQMWLTYAPIPDFVMSFYSISRTDVDWFSVVFFIVSVVVGFVGIFILDTWGLKISVSSVGPMAYNLLYTVKRGIKCVRLCAYVYWPSLGVGIVHVCIPLAAAILTYF